MGKRRRHEPKPAAQEQLSKSEQLVKNPVHVEDKEFNKLDTFEELKEFKFLGTNKSKKPFLQDWHQQGLKVKLSQPQVLESYQEMELPPKTKISGKTAKAAVTDSEESENEEKIKPSKIRKVENKHKVTYDKSNENCETISKLKEKGNKLGAVTPKKNKRKVDVSAWDELHVPESIKEALSEMGLSTPTPIQEVSIGPAIKDRSDILGAAETGSGKTLAFAIPIISGIQRDRNKIRANILKKQNVEECRERTKMRKKEAKEILEADGLDDTICSESSSEEDSGHEEDSEFVETDEEGVEEYLFNGEDGICNISYDELNNEDGKKENLSNSDLEEENMSDDDESMSGEELDEENMSDEELEEDMSEFDEDHDSDELNSNNDDDDEFNEDFGSDDEEDFEGDDDGKKIGLVRAMNDVQFPFLKPKAKLEENEEKPLLRALILTPTRELAVQIHKHIVPICEKCNIKSGVVVGGLDARKQKRILKRTCPEILVATPGRLWELIKEGVHHLKELGAVRYLAIDEADRMIDPKNFEEVGKIVRLLNGGTLKNKSGTDRQTFIFSATLTLVHQLPKRVQLKKKSAAAPSSEDKLQNLAKMVGCKNSAKVFDITRKTATAENLTECRINCEKHEKDYYLYYFLLRHPGRTMVFCNSIVAVKRLKSVFTTLKMKPMDLHASMHQKQRLRNLQEFSTRGQGLLITTDVAARGLDIKGVQHVIHFQVPFTAESYVHRSGRTARASHSGLSIVFVEPKDLLRFKQICTTLGRTDVSDIPLFNVDESIYDQVTPRVDLAVEVEKLEFVSRRQDKDKEGNSKASKDIGILESEDEMDQEDLALISAPEQLMRLPSFRKKKSNSLKKELDILLSKPIVGAMFSYNHPRSKASIASVVGGSKNSVPDSLVGFNPTETIVETPEESYKERYAKELFGDVPFEPGVDKLPSFQTFKQQRKQMAKLTKKLLKPELSVKADMKKMRQRKIEKMKEKATKKREKKRAKRKARKMK